MMNDFIVKVEKTTRMVTLTKSTIGNDFENLQEKLIFKFTDNFVDGTGRLEYSFGSAKNYILLTKENNTYTIPIKNVLNKEGKIEMQLVITENEIDEEIPVFKSNVFYLYCNKSINAVNEAPDGYELWIEQANAKLNLMDQALTEVDNLNIDVNKIDTTTTVEITKKDGTIKEVEILDGVSGQDGKDGQDGITPTIGQNGNWYLGDTDTGKPSRGINGENGQDGQDGQDGYTPQKGIDYFTNEDISEIETDILNDIEIPTKLSDLTDDLGSNPIHTHSQYLTSHQDISGKQNIEDNSLDTVHKTIPTAINEVNSIAKGANQALSYSNYQAMITTFNTLANNVYKVGQNVMIVTLQVPDLWISGIENTSQSYTYTSDSDFTNALATNGYVQVGYYKLSALETQKVDLTNYVTNTDYANTSKAGVIKSSSTYATNVASGVLQSATNTYSDYTSGNNNMFISKGTLENVLTGKGFITSHQDITGKEDKSNKVTSISSSSTDTQYPSAKCVYDYIQSLDGDEVNY